MDTTGAHINGNSTPKDKSGDFSREELSAILKFGAQNLYKTDESAQSKKLDEMDLDDILTKADAFDTESAAQPGGTSLGGEGFLSQFAAIQDVKNDMDDELSWDDIIPVEERVKLDEDESRALAAEEAAAVSRKRKAAQQPGAYQDMDFDDDGTSSKPGSPGGKKARVGQPRKSNAQKALELKERDLRVLIRGIQKWGDIRVRYDLIVKEARLEGKNRVLITQTCEEIIQTAEDAVNAHRAHLRDLQDRGEPISSSLRQKAVLFEYKGVGGLNAETVVNRYYELKAVNEHFKRIEDLEGYEIPVENLKPTMNWTVNWERADDSHLIVGISRHGFGSWDIMKDVSDKFDSTDSRTQHYIWTTRFSWKIPKRSKIEIPMPQSPVFPVQSIWYDGEIICAGWCESMKRIGATCWNNNKFSLRCPSKKALALNNSHCHLPLRLRARNSKRPVRWHRPLLQRAKRSVARRQSIPIQRTTIRSESLKPAEIYLLTLSSSMDEDQVKELLRPAKKHLKKLKSGTDNLSREEKIAALKECVAGIGNRIDEVVAIKQAEGASGGKWRKHCWVFAAFFWPREGVNYTKLMDIHKKLVSLCRKSLLRRPPCCSRHHSSLCRSRFYYHAMGIASLSAQAGQAFLFHMVALLLVIVLISAILGGLCDVHNADRQVNESSPAPSKPKPKAKRKSEGDPDKPKKKARAAPKSAKDKAVKAEEESAEGASANGGSTLQEEAAGVQPPASDSPLDLNVKVEAAHEPVHGGRPHEEEQVKEESATAV